MKLRDYLYNIVVFIHSFIQQTFIENLHCKQYSRSNIYCSNKPENSLSPKLSQGFHSSGGGGDSKQIISEYLSGDDKCYEEK